MSTKNKPLTTKSLHNPSPVGCVDELSGEAMRNLAGFFDVLIQMDLIQKQRNHMEKKYDDTIQRDPKGTTTPH